MSRCVLADVLRWFYWSAKVKRAANHTDISCHLSGRADLTGPPASRNNKIFKATVDITETHGVIHGPWRYEYTDVPMTARKQLSENVNSREDRTSVQSTGMPNRLGHQPVL